MSEVTNIDPVMEKPWQRAKRFEMYDYYAKSRYPPMQIEPSQDERGRLAGKGMTPEQRALRKQWVKDQILHHEPRHVEGLQPYNIFRRIYRWPADNLIYKPLAKMFNPLVADSLRYGIPKVLMGIGLSYMAWYNIKYRQMDWTRNGGVIVTYTRPYILTKEDLENYPEKSKTDFYDKGFKSRTALLNYKGPEGDCSGGSRGDRACPPRYVVASE